MDSPIVSLSDSQIKALSNVRHRAIALNSEFRLRIPQELSSRVQHLADLLRKSGQIDVHFHPDRVYAPGKLVIDGLLEWGEYKSQFETGISNGSKTAHAGGLRDELESELFQNAFGGTTPRERPKYGSLNLFHFADGSSPRFGSCYFILKPHVLRRTSFALGDSVSRPAIVATYETLEVLLLAAIESVLNSEETLGRRWSDPEELLSRVEEAFAATSIRNWMRVGRILDDYVECQVHGNLRLDLDVSGLVVDAAYKNSAVYDRLLAICSENNFPIYFHPGFELDVANVPRDFRGERMPDLAKSISRGLKLNVVDIGRADNQLQSTSTSWSDWGTKEETVQNLKQLWHVLVNFGQAVT